MRNTIVLIMISIVAAGCLTEVPTTGLNDDSTAKAALSVTGTAPLQITVGDEYQFTPTVSDLGDDTLTFSITGLPRWASFDASTGELSGTPRSGDVGTYSNIVITATDGTDSVSVGPFAIIVSDTTYGSVTLSWTAPTQNEDGSTLTDLDGYRLYWRKVSGDYSGSTTIDNESITTFVVDNIPSGTYEFVATSFNTAGIESRYSNPATKVVP